MCSSVAFVLQVCITFGDEIIGNLTQYKGLGIFSEFAFRDIMVEGYHDSFIVYMTLSNIKMDLDQHAKLHT